MPRSIPAAPPIAAWPPPGEPRSFWALHAWVRERDPLGHQVHAALAAMYLLLLPLATMPKEPAFAVLFVYALLRLRHTWRLYSALLREPLTWALLAWAAWQAASMLWSREPVEGFDEFQAMRMLATPLLIWPILDRAPFLIAAFLVGVFATNVVQGLQLAGWLPVDDPGRHGGWLHPIQTGALCLAAACWHFAAALWTRGMRRWLSIIALAAALGGLLASGSRGPWIAAAVTLPLEAIVLMVRRPSLRRAGLVVVAASLLLLTIAVVMARQPILERIDRTVQELQQESGQRDAATSGGLRLAMWSWAYDMFRAQPLKGIGAGSYRAVQQELPAYRELLERQPADAEYFNRTHPHSIYLYALACTGVVGAALLAVVLLILLRQCWRDRPDHWYADGNFFVLVSWLLGAIFECYNLEGTMMGLFGLLCAVTMRLRPPPRLAWAAIDPQDRVSAAGHVGASDSRQDRRLP
jgi:O-antigen ligase